MDTCVFITPNLLQPRCIKRVESFYLHGYTCIVYGYTRGIYDVNSYASGIDVRVLSSLNSINDGNKLQQIDQDVRRIVKENKGKDVLYYAFGMLPARTLCRLHKPYVYEISDIMYAYPKFKRIEWLFKLLDRHYIRKSVATVMTSDGFRRYLGVANEDVILLPNKVNRALAGSPRQSLSVQDRFRFGFVGAIRYDSVLRFAEVIGKYFPQHEFHFYGGTGKRVEMLCRSLTEQYPNVVFHGSFVNPDDLPSIYSSLDIIVACYDISSVNERIAEPNKLYEAMFFCRPIVVSSGIFLSDQVAHYHCGFDINAKTETSIREFISGLKPEVINSISSEEARIPTTLLLDDSSLIVDKISEFYS